MGLQFTLTETVEREIIFQRRGRNFKNEDCVHFPMREKRTKPTISVSITVLETFL